MSSRHGVQERAPPGPGPLAGRACAPGSWGSWASGPRGAARTAGSLRTAAVALDAASDSAGLLAAAAELEDASCVTGCISLAAAAGPNLRAAGEALQEGSGTLRGRADDLASGPTAAHAEASESLRGAADALDAAGLCLVEAGDALEG